MKGIAGIILLVVVMLAVVGCTTVIAVGVLVAGGVLMVTPAVSSEGAASAPTVVAEHEPGVLPSMARSGRSSRCTAATRTKVTTSR